jgi:hypothetical protein
MVDPFDVCVIHSADETVDLALEKVDAVSAHI